MLIKYYYGKVAFGCDTDIYFPVCNPKIFLLFRMNYALLLLVLCWRSIHAINAYGPEVVGQVLAQSTSGPIKGLQYKTDKGMVNTYFSIPYGKSPVGPLRFKAPEPVEPWIEALEATRQPNCCMQPIENLLSHSIEEPPRVSEDCLYLNIWTPATQNLTDALPVIVVIHGGRFVVGCINMKIYNGFRLASVGNVIVVSMNYRLGAFGFLNLGLDGAPGNMGLMDQQLALRWVHDNVRYFGGDPNKILLFGDSSGGSSVVYQMLSPGSKGLFSNAFVQSGNILSSLSFIPNPVVLSASLGLANYTNCPISNPQATLDCLMSKSVLDITIDTQRPAHFGPSVDGQFISKDPKGMLLGGQIPSRVPLVTGVTKDEGALFVAAGFIPCSREVVANNVTDDLLFLCAKSFLRILPDDLVQAVIRHYKTVEFEHLDANRRVMVNLVGDVMFVCPSRELTSLYSSGESTKVYAYVFDYATEAGKLLTEEWMGVIHGSDFSLLLSGDLQPQDSQMSNKMIQFVSSFADQGYIHALLIVLQIVLCQWKETHHRKCFGPLS